jgi:hypothetical protein
MTAMNDASAEPGGPVAVLTYAGSGIPRLRAMMETLPELEWLVGANLVQLCDRVARDWKIIDNRGGQLSGLARRGVMVLVGSMLMPRLAASGKRRWCTPALASTPESASTFAALFPGARFISLHRSCLDVIYAGLAACPWGLAGNGQGYDAFAAGNPGNSVAALAEYWCTQTERMLGIEDAHPDRCMRVLYEDLDADPEGLLGTICAYLGLTSASDPAGPPAAVGTSIVGCGREVPVDRIPPHLMLRVSTLTRRLGYSALAPVTVLGVASAGLPRPVIGFLGQDRVDGGPPVRHRRGRPVQGARLGRAIASTRLSAPGQSRARGLDHPAQSRAPASITPPSGKRGRVRVNNFSYTPFDSIHRGSPFF